MVACSKKFDVHLNFITFDRIPSSCGNGSLGRGEKDELQVYMYV